ncbi:hypothetical protein ACFY8C_08115 [Streptomyces flavochromogenes]|uniref:Uncharacterized protein n=1 Tax=Streptomyces flavochromogenes TaxID=68199 RepID=A0ABW6XLE2_9ACTN|nr:hypothetical protein [Streptomyces flavochromogenes]
MSHQDNSVFVDASGRRGRVVRWGAAGVGLACLGFLGIVVAGSFGAGPAGGPLPWADDERQDAPALIQPDPAASGDSGDSGTSDGAPASSSTPRATVDTSDAPATPTPTPTNGAATAAPSPEASSAPTATTPSPETTPGGGGSGGGDRTDSGPGKADEAPGATKRPK